MTAKAKVRLPVVERDARDPQPTDAERTEGGLAKRPLRQILEAIETLEKLSQSGEPGDIGVSFYGTLDVIQGEVGEGGDVEAGEELVGWLVCVENWWEFIPCMPVLHWSSTQSRYVDLETIRDENIAEREKREQASAAAPA